MQTEKFSRFWKEDGSINDNVPEWIKKRDQLRDLAFPSPYVDQPDRLQESMRLAVEKMDALKSANKGWGCLGEEPTDPQGPDYGRAKAARLGKTLTPLEEVIQQSADLFKGMPHWNHPMVMPNVVRVAIFMG